MKPHTLKHIHESTEAIYKELDALYIIWPLLFLQGQKPPPSGWFWAPQYPFSLAHNKHQGHFCMFALCLGQSACGREDLNSFFF